MTDYEFPTYTPENLKTDINFLKSIDTIFNHQQAKDDLSMSIVKLESLLLNNFSNFFESTLTNEDILVGHDLSVT